MNRRFARTMLVTRWPREIDPGWLQPVLSHRGTVDISMFIAPVPEDEAAMALQRQIVQYRSTEILGRGDLGIEVSREDAERIGKSVVKGETRVHDVGLYFTVYAETLEKLEEETRQLRTRLRKVLVKVEPVTFRQRRGLMTTLPLGEDLIKMRRRLHSEVVGDMIPFATGGFTGHPDTGIFFGEVLATGGPALIDRFRLFNHNQLVLSASGCGKSYAVKCQVGAERLRGVEVTILDPEGEYELLTNTLGGEIIRPGTPGWSDPPAGGLVCYSLKDVPDEQLGTLAGQVLATVWERVRRQRDIRKLVVVDEGFLMLVANPLAEKALRSIVKRSRKYLCGLVVISQDLDEFLRSDAGAAIIQNSSIKVLLRQDENVIPLLRQSFKLADGECEFLTSAPQGAALVIAGNERARIKITASSFEHRYCQTDTRVDADGVRVQ